MTWVDGLVFSAAWLVVAITLGCIVQGAVSPKKGRDRAEDVGMGTWAGSTMIGWTVIWVLVYLL